VLDEIEAEITRLQAGLPPEALAEIARLRSYYIRRAR
jgi:cell division protein FtsB